VDDLDGELRALVREAYAIGAQRQPGKHLAKAGA
jgi:hypothetical protein